MKTTPSLNYSLIKGGNKFSFNYFLVEGEIESELFVKKKKERKTKKKFRAVEN